LQRLYIGNIATHIAALFGFANTPHPRNCTNRYPFVLLQLLV
jgi:hypothetical protein